MKDIKLLLRNLPKDYKDEWTNLLAPPEEITDSYQEPFLIFHFGDELYGLKLDTIYNITESKKIHPVPMIKNRIVKGIASIDGQLKPIIDLSRLLKIPASPITKSKWILVGNHKNFFGFEVPDLFGIINCDIKDILKPPANLSDLITGTYLLNGQNVALLNMGGVLDDRRFFI